MKTSQPKKSKKHRTVRVMRTKSGEIYRHHKGFTTFDLSPKRLRAAMQVEHQPYGCHSLS